MGAGGGSWWWELVVGGGGGARWPPWPPWPPRPPLKRTVLKSGWVLRFKTDPDLRTFPAALAASAALETNHSQIWMGFVIQNRSRFENVSGRSGLPGRLGAPGAPCLPPHCFPFFALYSYPRNLYLSLPPNDLALLSLYFGSWEEGGGSWRWELV